MLAHNSSVYFTKKNARQTIGMLLFIFTSILPALILTGFFPVFGAFDFGLTTWLVIAIIGGALGGSLCITNLKSWYLGLIAGVLSGPGMLLAVYYYTLSRTHILSIEILIPIIIGGLPGWLFLVIVTAISLRRTRAQQAFSVGQNMPITPNQPPQYPADDPRYQ